MVDFEYGGANCAAYDIGNHFCEFAGQFILLSVKYRGGGRMKTVHTVPAHISIMFQHKKRLSRMQICKPLYRNNRSCRL